MATTEFYIDPASASYPVTNPAAPVEFQGSNSPVRGHAFDASTRETIFLSFVILKYGSGDIDLDLLWYADVATTGSVVWDVALWAITPDADTTDMEAKGFATAQQVTDAHLGTTGQREHRARVTITNLDGVQSGDKVTLRIARDAPNGSDTMPGDAILTDHVLSYSDT